MSLTRIARSLAALFALLAWAALVLQLYLSINISQQNGVRLGNLLINYFSYFTIFINLFAAVMFTSTALTPSGPPPGLRTAAAVYIAVVGIGYSLLLRHIWDPQGLQKLADILLHDVIPILYVFFWFIFLSRRRALPWSSALIWLIWPLIYLIYSILRGSVTGWYPYYFLDPRAFSYSSIITTIVVFLLAFTALGFIAVAITRRRAHTDA